jgi:hypothetical protein
LVALDPAVIFTAPEVEQVETAVPATAVGVARTVTVVVLFATMLVEHVPPAAPEVRFVIVISEVPAVVIPTAVNVPEPATETVIEAVRPVATGVPLL